MIAEIFFMFTHPLSFPRDKLQRVYRNKYESDEKRFAALRTFETPYTAKLIYADA